MKIGDKYKFKGLVEGGPTTQPQLPNEFQITEIKPQYIGLIQTGQVGKEPTLFAWDNFERDFEPIL
jgi:hypothetical protein